MTSGPAPAWFAIIDGAQDPRLEALVRSCVDHVCLFKGELHPALSQAAPWLVRIDERDPLLDTWRQHGKAQNWGIMLLSSLDLHDLRRQLRRFLQARLPDGTIALFRFYDPRAFNTYMAAATPPERELWFDGIAQYSVEDEHGEISHHYRFEAGRLMDGQRLVA